MGVSRRAPLEYHTVPVMLSWVIGTVSIAFSLSWHRFSSDIEVLLPICPTHLALLLLAVVRHEAAAWFPSFWVAFITIDPLAQNAILMFVMSYEAAFRWLRFWADCVVWPIVVLSTSTAGVLTANLTISRRQQIASAFAFVASHSVLLPFTAVQIDADRQEMPDGFVFSLSIMSMACVSGPFLCGFLGTLIFHQSVPATRDRLLGRFAKRVIPPQAIQPGIMSGGVVTTSVATPGAMPATTSVTMSGASPVVATPVATISPPDGPLAAYGQLVAWEGDPSHSAAHAASVAAYQSGVHHALQAFHASAAADAMQCALYYDASAAVHYNASIAAAAAPHAAPHVPPLPSVASGPVEAPRLDLLSAEPSSDSCSDESEPSSGSWRSASPSHSSAGDEHAMAVMDAHDLA